MVESGKSESERDQAEKTSQQPETEVQEEAGEVEKQTR